MSESTPLCMYVSCRMSTEDLRPTAELKSFQKLAIDPSIYKVCPAGKRHGRYSDTELVGEISQYLA